MADVIVASEAHIMNDARSAPAARKLFERPEVEDLGRLQELTMLQGVTIQP